MRTSGASYTKSSVAAKTSKNIHQSYYRLAELAKGHRQLNKPIKTPYTMQVPTKKEREFGLNESMKTTLNFITSTGTTNYGPDSKPLAATLKQRWKTCTWTDAFQQT